MPAGLCCVTGRLGSGLAMTGSSTGVIAMMPRAAWRAGVRGGAARGAARRVVRLRGLGRAPVARARGRPRGIEIGRDDGQVTVDLHVVVEYGLNLAEVASSVSNRVAYEVERLTGLGARPLNEIKLPAVRLGGDVYVVQQTKFADPEGNEFDLVRWQQQPE